MKTNKEILEAAVKKEAMNLGCWDKGMELLNRNNLNKVIKGFKYGSCDIAVCINRRRFVVEVSHVDNEVDFSLISAQEYKAKYGRAYDEE